MLPDVQVIKSVSGGKKERKKETQALIQALFTKRRSNVKTYI